MEYGVTMASAKLFAILRSQNICEMQMTRAHGRRTCAKGETAYDQAAMIVCQKDEQNMVLIEEYGLQTWQHCMQACEFVKSWWCFENGPYTLL